MRTPIAILCAVGLFAMLATPVRAEFDAKDLKEIEAKLKAGNGFVVTDAYPDSDDFNQRLRFEAGWLYQIDFRARLCAVEFGTGAGQLIPCKIIKKAYPDIGKLITWDKDGWAE